MIYEDFYPITDELALITSGEDYEHLQWLKIVTYKVGSDSKVIITNDVAFKKGTHIRLGNIYNGKIVYSDNNVIEPFNIKGEQPFMTNRGVLYTNDGGIYEKTFSGITIKVIPDINNVKIIDLWGDIKELGNPCEHDGWIYFEARKEPAPMGWQIWKFNIKTSERKLVREYGANPYVFRGKLYFSKWDGKKFETLVEEL